MQIHLTESEYKRLYERRKSILREMDVLLCAHVASMEGDSFGDFSDPFKILGSELSEINKKIGRSRPKPFIKGK